MTTAIDASTAMTLAKAQPVTTPVSTKNAQAAKDAASKFEQVFITEFLGSMFADIPTDGPFGGGQGEAMFRSLMVDQYAKQMEKQGGFGLAAPVAKHLLQLQEAHQ